MSQLYRLFLGVYELLLKKKQLVKIIVTLLLIVNRCHHFVKTFKTLGQIGIVRMSVWCELKQLLKEERISREALHGFNQKTLEIKPNRTFGQSTQQ